MIFSSRLLSYYQKVQNGNFSKNKIIKKD